MTPALESGRKPHIVLIEDNPGDVFLLKCALTRNGIECDITRFEDGDTALEALLADVGTPLHADLILVDLNLPRRDGKEVLKAVRENPRLAGTRIAVITSSFSTLDREESLRLGAAQYIHKPTHLTDFVEGVGGAIISLLR